MPHMIVTLDLSNTSPAKVRKLLARYLARVQKDTYEGKVSKAAGEQLVAAINLAMKDDPGTVIIYEVPAAGTLKRRPMGAKASGPPQHHLSSRNPCNLHLTTNQL